ncbi:MAG TPA: fumarylacetoacetase [Bryobacteraceae bacterium]|nr:fumarylacetoacetase [Bryobacteraceae bacterium]
MSASDFSIHNLPFGVFEAEGRPPRAGIAIGEKILDLAGAAAAGHFDDLGIPDPEVFSQRTLNAFIALGKPHWRAVRARAARILEGDPANLLVEQRAARMLLPVAVGDYVDFYSSEEHATNVGSMFRDPKNALMPNWKYLPVGYHGRSSSVILGGQDVHRPKGQINPANGIPEFAPSRALDFELEMAFIVGRDTALGSSLRPDDAEDCIFGMTLLNDWSARDIQRWEYVPLGPFLGKSFATSISPWIVTLDALEPFRVAGPPQDPPPLDYLRTSGDRNLDIELEVWLQPESEAEPMRVCRTNFRGMYWNMAQQLAHLTSNGTNLRVGDLCGSGTISGRAPDSFGSMLELCWNGARPLKFPGGAVRSFVEDGDTVIMRAFAGRDRNRVGFGELKTKILPAV